MVVPGKHGRKLLTRIESSGGCKTLPHLIVTLGVLRFSQEGRGELSNQQANADTEIQNRMVKVKVKVPFFVKAEIALFFVAPYK